jgi:Uma2 family endonuclease
MSCAVLFEEQLRIPPINSLADFRKWLRAGDFPERGRIDYVAGQIEVDMSPEDLYMHGSPKTEIATVINNRVKLLDCGEVYIDRARISCPDADLSVEPDVVFLSDETLDGGSIQLVSKASQEPDRYIEIEGAPDLVVEIVSDSSESKDTKRLPQSYFLAGVKELWIVDVRKSPLKFVIYYRGKRGFAPAPVQKDGFAHSKALNADYSLQRQRNLKGRLRYTLHERTDVPARRKRRG